MNIRSCAKKVLATGFGPLICALLLNSRVPLRADDAPQPLVPVPTPLEELPLGKFEPKWGTVYHGASLPSTWDEAELRRQFQHFQSTSGKSPAIVTWFANTYESGRPTSWPRNYAPTLARVKRLNAVSLIKFSTQDSNFYSSGKAATPKQITAGEWDFYLNDFADSIKAFGSPVFISIDHEMNGSWYPYSEAAPKSQGSAADYVKMWRHIVEVFRQRGVTNVAWVWSPTARAIGGVPTDNYYPGDDYVNWIGVSFYSNYGINDLDPLYNTYSQRKPFFVTEWATAPSQSRFNPKYPGDTAWINLFFEALETRYRRVKAISWFEWNHADGNYTLERNPEQIKFYTNRIKNPRYLGKADELLKPWTKRDSDVTYSAPPSTTTNPAVPADSAMPRSDAPPTRPRLKLKPLPSTIEPLPGVAAPTGK